MMYTQQILGRLTVTYSDWFSQFCVSCMLLYQINRSHCLLALCWCHAEAFETDGSLDV